MSCLWFFFLFPLTVQAVIYGTNDRQDVWKNGLHKKLAESVAIAVPSHFLRGANSGTEIIQQLIHLKPFLRDNDV